MAAPRNADAEGPAPVGGVNDLTSTANATVQAGGLMLIDADAGITLTGGIGSTDGAPFTTEEADADATILGLGAVALSTQGNVQNGPATINAGALRLLLGATFSYPTPIY